MSKHTVKIPLHTATEGLALFGPQDKFLRLIQSHTNVFVTSRKAEVSITGDAEEVKQMEQLFAVLLELIRNHIVLSERDIRYALDLLKEWKTDELLDLFKNEIAYTNRGKPIYVKTVGQRHYVSTIQKKDIVFGIGPAGTGKTYLAVILAVVALKENAVRRIVLTRPAVEAGENLGFLPGDLQEKVDPYLRPLYDALYDVMSVEQVTRAFERGFIEIAPLAYMRGRTLDDAFIILDEAQNTTPEQMKMFLTRLGFGSKMIVTGDVTQIDLPGGKRSGLIEAQQILQHIKEIGFVYFAEQDVVRHSLVQKVITAYQQKNENSG